MSDYPARITGRTWIFIDSLLAVPGARAIFFAHNENAVASFVASPDKYVLLLKPFHLADLLAASARFLLGDGKNADGTPLAATINNSKSHKKEPARQLRR